MANAIRHLALDTYLTYAQLTELLRDLATAYPILAILHNIRDSHQGHTIWLLEICNPNTGPAADKPGYWIDAHRDELVAKLQTLLHQPSISAQKILIASRAHWPLCTQHKRSAQCVARRRSTWSFSARGRRWWATSIWHRGSRSIRISVNAMAVLGSMVASIVLRSNRRSTWVSKRSWRLNCG